MISSHLEYRYAVSVWNPHGKYDNKTAEWIAGKCIEKRHDTRNHCIATVTCSFDMRINLVFFLIGLSQYG